MLSCKEASKLVSESLDLRLPLKTRLRLRLHLSMCRICTAYYRQLHFLRRVIGVLPDHVEAVNPEPLSEEAKQRISKFIGSDK